MLFRGKKVKVYDTRQNAKDNEFKYELRGSDDDFGKPMTIERYVAVNFVGTMFTKEEILGDRELIPLTEDESEEFARNL